MRTFRPISKCVRKKPARSGDKLWRKRGETMVLSNMTLVSSSPAKIRQVFKMEVIMPTTLSRERGALKGELPWCAWLAIRRGRLCERQRGEGCQSKQVFFSGRSFRGPRIIQQGDSIRCTAGKVSSQVRFCLAAPLPLPACAFTKWIR